MNKITVENNEIVNVCLPVIFFKVKEYPSRVFAECPALRLATDGRDLEDAKKMFEEELALWVGYVSEKRNMHKVLRSLGWKLGKRYVLPPEQIDTKEPVRPVALNSANLSIPAIA
ncbi:MAG: hypothetical protein LBL61_01435 [Elusimicrobiota bacterium]|jgi:hypothetical protein|nr:hypothetical protein [Elusimicrobiota bacterium]